MPKKEYPYKNRSLKNIKGEQWEDIPGMYGYFQVSNFGRIKRLRRESIAKSGILRVYNEQIIAPRVGKTPNTYTSDLTYQLSAHLGLDGKKYHIPIRRLVYYCFVSPFDLEDSSINIVSKKGNGLDVRPANLLMLTDSQLWRRVVDKKRVILEFRSPNIHRIGMLASLKYTSKQISQYDRKGKKIKTYPSIMEASRQTGISYSRIRNTAAEIDPTAGGYFWAYGKGKRFDVKTFLEKRHKGYKEKKGTKVTQYDFQGNRIARYLTLTDAANAVGVKSYTSISAVIRGISHSAFGYLWKRGWGKEKITVK
jgi:hypothetical protein